MRLDRAAVCLLTLSIAAGAVVTARAIPAKANGFTLFSGVAEENRLRSFLQENGQLSETDRYKLYIPAEKLTTATSLFVVSYPEEYDGIFDEDEIELRVDGDEIPLACVRWDQQNFNVEIIPEEPIPAETRKVAIVFSDVRNPRRTSTHYFNAFVQPPTATGEVPAGVLENCLNPSAAEVLPISTDVEPLPIPGLESTSPPIYIGTWILQFSRN
ncbi:MAG: DUF2808 domain-containing protein [Leptolyngbyaceae bacterium]|nr:DUF2808 domain-containing protein [Leptolyngbyaceae bacterium]